MAAAPDLLKERANLIYRATLAEKVEEFEGMVECMKQIATSTSGELSTDERELLSAAYKNIVGLRRSSWRTLQKEESKLLARQDTDQHELNIVREFKGRVEKQVNDVSNDIISLIDKYLLPNTHSDEGKVFYYKMKADYYRYKTEFTYNEERKENVEHSLAAYKAASEIANSKLLPTNPVRLGLASNFSVFYFGTLNLPDEAIKLAKNAYDSAKAGLDDLSDEDYKDSSFLLKLLRDNLELWKTDSPREKMGTMVLQEVKEDEGEDKDKSSPVES